MKKIFLSLAFIASFNANASFTESSSDLLEFALPAAAASIAYLVERDGEGLEQFGYSLGATVLTTYALKTAVDKERPNGKDDDAFPSGHAALTFSSAGFLHRRYGWQYALPAYLLAGYTGYARVQTDNHEVVDVLAGAAIGLAFNHFIVSPHPDLAIAPYYDGETAGIVGQFTF
ncbi:phosphatase PAP2 family protein [Ferrimonas sediminicola]|uniref:Phosphatase PAP2 family protein n=1 Tax=Ferrimonas sediminicola TaxID=2569538 RepID=A0A4U1BCK9_9GAMM|nr:phosphatase PAP2 family protein [Ferrimonas sediminicola]TKB48727.1 phosphatase PAP2 family protein [Ferrimonas sediminicola]